MGVGGEGNLSILGSSMDDAIPGGYRSVRAVQGVSNGCWYYEILVPMPGGSSDNDYSSDEGGGRRKGGKKRGGDNSSGVGGKKKKEIGNYDDNNDTKNKEKIDDIKKYGNGKDNNEISENDEWKEETWWSDAVRSIPEATRLGESARAQFQAGLVNEGMQNEISRLSKLEQKKKEQQQQENERQKREK